MPGATTTYSVPARQGDIVVEDTPAAEETDSRTLVFLHGGAANLRSWDGVISSLGNRCIAIDLPGHGKSTIDPLRFDSLTEVLQDLNEQLGVKKPILIGHSFGGLAAIAAGSLNGDLWGGVMAVDPRLSNAEVHQAHSTLDSALRELKDMTWPWFEVNDLEAEVERVVARMTIREDMTQLRAMVRRGYRKQGNGKYIRFPRREDEMKGVEANWSIDVDEAYRSVRCPLAVALAGQDKQQLAGRDRIVEALSRIRPVNKMVFDCNHDIPGYRPHALARFIREWLAELDS
jgi:pimeloyl-ACP methyl ester carboxylesterase